MFEGMTFATAFISIVGVIIVFVGFHSFTRGIRYAAKEAVFTGKVMMAKHFERRNAKKDLIQNYYELQLSCSDGNRTFGAKVKSPDEYVKGDTVRLTKRPDGTVILYKANGIRWWSGVLEILIGAGIAAFPYAVNRYGDPYASLVLAGVLLLGGILMLEVFFRDRRRTYEELDAEVKDILLYDVESQRRVLKTNTWYPLLQYEKDGETREFLSESNSSLKSAYTVGKKIKVYRDTETGEIREKRASAVLPLLAAVFFILAVVGLAAVL